MTTNSSAICKCDRLCHMFQDCCCQATGSQEESTTLSLDEGVKFECFSKFVSPDITVVSENEAFLMTASCPRRGSDLASERRCVNSSSSLPPVTDLTTGLVYRNEHCALCNGVTEVIAWGYQLTCSSHVLNLITSNTFSDTLMKDPDLLKTSCNLCSFLPPDLASPHLPRSCVPSIQTCLPRSMLARISEMDYITLGKQCLSGPPELVHASGDKPYYNRACAACNSVSLRNRVQCFVLQNRTFDEACTLMFTSILIGRPSTIPLTLSNLGNGKILLTSDNEVRSASVSCPAGEVLVGVDCRPTVCPQGYSHMGGRCSSISEERFVSSNSADGNCSTLLVISKNETYYDFLNDTILMLETRQIVEVIDYDKLGHPIVCVLGNSTVESLNCTSGFVKLKKSEFIDFKNGSIAFKNITVEVSFYDSKDGSPVVCLDQIKLEPVRMRHFLFIEELPGIQELTYIGCSLSLLGSTAVLFTYAIFKELRTFPGIILMNMCITMIGISALFLFGGPILQFQPLIGICSTTAIFLHYFYLTQFSWMTIFSFEVTRTFYRATKQLYKSRKDKIRLLLLYLFLGWFIPLGAVIISIALNYSTSLIQYGVDRHGQLAGCWINHFSSLIAIFIVPLVLSLIFNVVCLFLTSVLLCKAYKTRAKYGDGQGAVLVRICLALFTMTGLTWLFGFSALHSKTYWMWYPFTIFNSTPGFFIFLNFLITNRIWSLYKELIKKMCIEKLSFRSNTFELASQPSPHNNLKTGTISYSF